MIRLDYYGYGYELVGAEQENKVAQGTHTTHATQT